MMVVVETILVTYDKNEMYNNRELIPGPPSCKTHKISNTLMLYLPHAST